MVYHSTTAELFAAGQADFESHKATRGMPIETPLPHYQLRGIKESLKNNVNAKASLFYCPLDVNDPVCLELWVGGDALKAQYAGKVVGGRAYIPHILPMLRRLDERAQAEAELHDWECDLTLNPTLGGKFKTSSRGEEMVYDTNADPWMNARQRQVSVFFEKHLEKSFPQVTRYLAQLPENRPVVEIARAENDLKGHRFFGNEEGIVPPRFAIQVSSSRRLTRDAAHPQDIIFSVIGLDQVLKREIASFVKRYS